MGKLFHKETEAIALIAEEEKALQNKLSLFLPVTEGKRTLLVLGRPPEYFSPKAALDSAGLLKLDLRAVVLLEGYDKKQREELLSAVRKYTDTPVITPGEGEKLLQNSDLILTTHELRESRVKQLFLPMLPKAGTAGELEFAGAVYRLLCSRNRRGEITYV